MCSSHAVTGAGAVVPCIGRTGAAGVPRLGGRRYRIRFSLVELRITVTVEPTERHPGQPLTRAQIEHVVALRAQIDAAVQAVLDGQTPDNG